VVVPLHMGSLHPVEQLLTLVLAFGPFVVLGGVIWWRRRTEDGTTDGVDQPDR
jgi:uncharacterized iron-regulated membrane protein